MAKKSALGDRPEGEFKRKLVGTVDVKVGKSKVKFTLVDEGRTFEDGTTSFVALKDELPSKPNIDAFDGKQLRIRMNQDGDAVDGLTPVVGHFPARLVDLGPRKKDEEPAPFEKIFGAGTPKENSHLEFFAVYEITKGAFKGVELPGYYLHYKFEEDETGNTRYAGSLSYAKATRLHQLKRWMELHKLEDTPIEWDDVSILPELLERALKSDVLVDLIFRDGYIQEVLPNQDEEDDEPDFMKDPEPEEEDDDFDADEIIDELGADYSGEPKKPKATKRKAKKVVEDDEDDDL